MRISVIIPVYNVEKYIARCIESILSQTFQDFEIVIVNDCTPDKSMEIVRRYAEQDNRIRIFNHDENMGLMWTRRTGYTNAQGEYFVFCDSDDYMPNNALELLYNAIIKTKADIVVGNHTYINTNGKSSIKSNRLDYGNDKESVYKSLLNREMSHSIWGKIFSRKLFDSHSYDCFKNHTNAEDAILFYELIQYVDSVQVIDDSVYNYMQNAESSTNRQLLNTQIICIEQFWQISYKLLSNNKKLMEIYYKCRYDSIIQRCKRGDYLSVIKENSLPSNFDYCLKFSTAIKYNNNVVSAILNYLLLNNKPIRQILIK